MCRGSNRRLGLGLLLGQLLGVGVVSPTRADGDYATTWHTLGSGGAAFVVAGDYRLSGALGQPDAHETLAAGDYLLRPGFWVIGADVPAELPAPGAAVPVRLLIAQPFPNPFRDTATFSVGIPASARLTLDVFSVNGRHVRTVVAREVDAGYVRVAWDGRDSEGRPVVDGMYFVRARLGDEESTVRTIRLRP